jgi:hypothetical protein
MSATEPVFRLLYRSHSRIADANENAELGRILRASRNNNGASGVTGALMFYDHWFAQVLEGPKAAVRALFEKIAADPRHDAVEIHDERTVDARVFSRWAMAHVGEHGHSDIPMTATSTGVAEAAGWSPTAEQESVLRTLRDLTRGYGIGA